MASIIFLVLALVSVVTAQDFKNLAKDGKLCYDQVPSCKDMPKSMCKDKKDQMQIMCPKTCGFCKQERIKVELMDPETTTEIFLLYLKNDIKFLKEEISDVKYRVREIVKRQSSHFELIQEQRKKLDEVRSNNDDNDTPFPPAQAPARAPQRPPFEAPPDASPQAPPAQVSPEYNQRIQRINAQMEMTQKAFSDEIQELRGYARTLSERIQGQHETIMQLARNMSSDIDEVRDKTQQKFHKIDTEILNLERELRRTTSELDSISQSKSDSSGPTVDSAGFADFKLESQRRQHQLQQSTSQAIGQLTNFTNRMAKQFMTSQQQFFGLLEQEREKTFNLEAMLSNLTYTINLERRQREQERIERGDPNQKFERRLQEMGKRIRDNKHHIVEERNKLRQSVRLISGLKTNLTNVTGEIGNSRRYLAYQYQYIVRNIQQLMQKLVLVEKNSKEVINKTLDQLKKNNRNKGADQIFHLAKEMREMEEKVERLQNQQFALTTAIEAGASSKSKVVLPPPVSPQLERAVKEVKSSIEEFRQTVADGKKRTDDFEVMVNNAVNFTETEIGDMKTAIMRMAELRNNESITQEDIRAKYQRGIFSLLGRQQSNKTRFFSPRFDFEGSRLSIHGYIAIYNEGEWGTICDDNFDDREANVLCRMAGYRGGVYDQGKYKVGGGLIDGLRRAEHKIWVDELRCDGTEERIQDCRTGSDGWGIHDCDHGEDIGIKCFIS